MAHVTHDDIPNAAVDAHCEKTLKRLRGKLGGLRGEWVLAYALVNLEVLVDCQLAGGVVEIHRPDPVDGEMVLAAVLEPISPKHLHGRRR